MAAPAPTNAPGIALVVVGALNILYAAFNATWSLAAVAWDAMIMYQVPPQGGVAVLYVVQAVTSLVQVLGYLVIALMGVVMIGGGLRLRQARSRGMVVGAAVAAVAAPLLGLLASGSSALGFACLGAGLGIVLTLPTLVLGLATAVAVMAVLGDERVLAAYAGE